MPGQSPPSVVNTKPSMERLSLTRIGQNGVYPDAQHGFHADYRLSYHRESAQDGWKRLQAWFKKYGAV